VSGLAAIKRGRVNLPCVILLKRGKENFFLYSFKRKGPGAFSLRGVLIEEDPVLAFVMGEGGGGKKRLPPKERREQWFYR